MQQLAEHTEALVKELSAMGALRKHTLIKEALLWQALGLDVPGPFPDPEYDD